MENSIYILNITSSIPNVNTKMQKLDDVKQSFLWHCRLHHINEKHVFKLNQSGYLDSFDYESFETCEFCLQEKMIKSLLHG